MYYGIIKMNQVHNITYGASKPVNLIHRLQQRGENGDSTKWVIIEYQYTTPMTIQVSANNTLVKSFPPQQWKDLTQYTNHCGANNYFYQNRTIHFVITGDKDCFVRVELINAIRVSLRLTMKIEDFISNDDAQTQFINRIAAFMKITTDRVRIVSIDPRHAGRRILQTDDAAEQTDIAIEILPESTSITDTVAETPAPTVPSSSPVEPTAEVEEQNVVLEQPIIPYDPVAVYLELSLQAAQLTQGFKSNSIDLGLSELGIEASVDEVSVEVFVVKDITDTSSEDVFTDEDLVASVDNSTNVNNNNSTNTNDNNTNTNYNSSTSDSDEIINQQSTTSALKQNDPDQDEDIILGITIACSLIVVGLIGYVVFKIVMSKKVVAVQVKPEELDYDDDEIKKVNNKDIIHESYSPCHNESPNQTLKNEAKGEKIQITPEDQFRDSKLKFWQEDNHQTPISGQRSNRALKELKEFEQRMQEQK